jgi:hypothetical protein
MNAKHTPKISTKTDGNPTAVFGNFAAKSFTTCPGERGSMQPQARGGGIPYDIDHSLNEWRKINTSGTGWSYGEKYHRQLEANREER